MMFTCFFCYLTFHIPVLIKLLFVKRCVRVHGLFHLLYKVKFIRPYAENLQGQLPLHRKINKKSFGNSVNFEDPLI